MDNIQQVEAEHEPEHSGAAPSAVDPVGQPSDARHEWNSDRKIKAVERRAQALQLRRAGFPYDVIAERLGYASRSGAYHAVMGALRDTLREPADELRKLELDRLDALLVGVWSAARQGDVAAVDRVLRIMERRARLLGLDAPQKAEVRAFRDVTELSDEELADIIRSRGGAAEAEESAEVAD